MHRQRRGERSVIEPEASSRNALPARAEPRAEMRDRPRTEGDVDERVQLEDAFPLRLGVAAADRDHARRIGTLACSLRAEVRGELRIRLLADRAGVEHDDVGLVGVWCLSEPELLEEPFDPLRVVRVHLAAERVNVVAPHRATGYRGQAASTRSRRCSILLAATSTARLSRITVTRIWPGYSR